jgi:hypothetical protein
VVDELSTRRSRFQPGTSIRLANDQEWIFPAPTAGSRFAFELEGAEYLGVIQAVLEAEDQSERRLAELALAIFLIGLNYQLSSTDLVDLLTFQPRSLRLADSQRAFELLAREHIFSLSRHYKLSIPVIARTAPRRPLASRFMSWLRCHGLLRKGLLRSRKSEALP